ncbi:MAG: ABC transporter permease [Defluviitaleaceae bacterium]|nr:ABC transporter permease [Defluviitaleaceae bacterium]MCL2835837.1 ABC transporter permease [Defluviitaleaceae bacterium]
MWKTILRRVLILIPQLFVLSVLIFFLAQFMPGDALRGMIGPDTTPEQYAILRQIHRLDDPWYVQYGTWMEGILARGDFGRSVTHKRPVTDIIGERMMNTVRLSLLTTLFTYIIAIPLGIFAAKKKDRFIDKSIMFYTFLALSMPTVVFSIINLFIFGFRLRWFPVRGSVDAMAAAGTLEHAVSRLHHLVLPAVTFALLSTISIIYFLRNEIIDYDASDFVTTARSKGVPENKVYTGHILRNALLPVAGNAGLIIAGLFTGSIFIESVFAYPGMGQLFVTSIVGRDFPVVNTLIMFYAILTVVSYLVTDILITIIDPRIHIK